MSAKDEVRRQALGLGPQDGVVLLEVESLREAELILALLQSNPPEALSSGPLRLARERIYAVVLLVERGLHIKSAGGEWEALPNQTNVWPVKRHAQVGL